MAWLWSGMAGMAERTQHGGGNDPVIVQAETQSMEWRKQNTKSKN